MPLDWDHETRRHLYCTERGSFAQLPLLARGLADEIMKHVDNSGCLYVGAVDPIKALCRLMGAHAGERREIRKFVPQLIEDGFLVAYPGALVIRNFIEAQYRRDAARQKLLRDELAITLVRAERELNASGARTEREPSTNRARVVHEPSTSGARTEHEPSTKTNVTPPNDTTPTVPSVPSVPIHSIPTIPSHPLAADPPEPGSPAEADPWGLSPLGSDSAHERGAKRPDVATPAEGTVARGVFDAIRSDPQLEPIVRRPAELSSRLADPNAFGALDPVGEVKRAAAWLAANPANRKKSGERFLVGWFERGQQRAPRVGVGRAMARPGHAPVSESFDDDGADPYDEILARRAEQNKRDAESAAKRIGGMR